MEAQLHQKAEMVSGWLRSRLPSGWLPSGWLPSGAQNLGAAAYTSWARVGLGGGICFLWLLCVRERRRRAKREHGRALLSAGDDCKVQRGRVLDAKFYLRSSDLYQLDTILPQIGTRRDRCFCKVRQVQQVVPSLLSRVCSLCCLGRERPKVLSVTTCCDAAILHDELAHKSIRDCFTKSACHPLLAPIEWIDVLPSSRLVVVVRDWVPSGSLRDRMHGVPPDVPYSSKFNRFGKPFSEVNVERYGWQLLQAQAT